MEKEPQLSREADAVEIVTKVARNALSAENASIDDDEILAAYRKGCASIAAKLYNNLRELKAFMLSSANLHAQQSTQFKKWVEDILSLDISVIGLKSAR